MDKKLKYIVTENGDFAIFTELSSHNEVARGLYGKPVGAGFAYIVNNKVTCFGRSVSLKIESRNDKDAEIIEQYINQ